MAIISQSQIKDPFQQAQNQYESRQLLSNSPIQQLSTPMDQPKENLEFDNLPLNESGKMQLINMLMSKYGDSFQQNPEAMKMLSDFDSRVKSSDNAQAMNQGLANANRTLGALFGGG